MSPTASAANWPDEAIHRRVFATLAVPTAISEALLARARLTVADPVDTPRLNWSPPANLHVTLVFFGDLDGAQLTRLCSALADLAPLPAPLLSPRRIGAFPDAAGSILAAHLAKAHLEKHSRLLALHSALWHTASRCDLAPRRESYRPHITLARQTKGSPPLPSPGTAVHGCEYTCSQYSLWKGVHGMDKEGRQYYRYQSLAEFSLAPH